MNYPTGINPAGHGGLSYGGAPDIRFQGFNAFPNNAIGVGWPKQVGPDGVTEFLDHVSVLKGKHSFKFGGEFIENQSHTNETANAKGPTPLQQPWTISLKEISSRARYSLVTLRVTCTTMAMPRSCRMTGA